MIMGGIIVSILSFTVNNAIDRSCVYTMNGTIEYEMPDFQYE